MGAKRDTFRGLGRIVCGAAMLSTALVAGVNAGELPKAKDILEWRDEAQVEGYRHIDRIFPTHVVTRGSRVLPLPRAASGIAPRYGFGGESGSVADYMTRNRTAGLIVVKDGHILLEEYALGETEKDRWIAFSMAKSVTSTLLGAAILDGKIGGVNDLVTRYIPELKGTAYDGVTLEQVLQMRSGAGWNEDYADPDSDVAQMGHAKGEPDGKALIAVMAKLPRAAAPGTRFNYSTGESDLIGIVVRRAVKEPLADYLSRKIWRPFGMESNASWVTDTYGMETGGCCINAVLRDYARIGLFAMEDGMANGARIVPRGWFAKATHPATLKAFGDLGYGYQWWIPGPGTFAAIGINGQSIYVDPARKLVIAEVSAWPQADWKEGYARQAALRTAIVEASDRP